MCTFLLVQLQFDEILKNSPFSKCAKPSVAHMVLPPGALGASVAGTQRVVRVVRRALRVRELHHVEKRERVHKPK